MTDEEKMLIHALLAQGEALRATVQALFGSAQDRAQAPRKQATIEPDGTIETMLRACEGKAVSHWLLSEIKRRPGITREELNKARGIAYSKGKGQPAHAQQSAAAVGRALSHARDHAAAHGFAIEGDDASGYTLVPVGKPAIEPAEDDGGHQRDMLNRWVKSGLDMDRLGLDWDAPGNTSTEVWSELFGRFISHCDLDRWADHVEAGFAGKTLREMADYYDARNTGPFSMWGREYLADFIFYLGRADSAMAAERLVDERALPVLVKSEEKEN